MSASGAQKISQRVILWILNTRYQTLNHDRDNKKQRIEQILELFILPALHLIFFKLSKKKDCLGILVILINWNFALLGKNFAVALTFLVVEVMGK